MKRLAPPMRAIAATAALAVLLAGGSTGAFAQAPQISAQVAHPDEPKPGVPKQPQPEPFKNLQVFPKDIDHDQLIAVMRSWTRGVGMRCDDCHVEDAKTHEHDFASDGMENKKTARQMLKMVLAINKDYISTLASHGGEPPQNVTCYSCHRGQAEPPRDLAATLTQIVMEKGTGAAMARYNELRKDHPTDGAYDFSDRALMVVAANLADAKRLDDAVAILRADVELYPTSANVHATLGRMLAEKGDLAGAEASLKKALEIDPKNERAKRMLAGLYEKKK